jgi:apolipoprotein N-acyltransferase
MYNPEQPRTRVFYPAIISGVIMYCTYFPLNLGFLAWFGLVPLLSLVDANARPRRIYFATFIGGLYFYLPAIQWIRVAHPAMYASWIGLSLACSLFLVLTMYLIRRLQRNGVPLWLSAPLAFVAVEYMRTHFPVGYEWMDYLGIRTAIGFGWYLVGHSQHDWLSLIQIADVTGVYGLTFLIVMVNTVLYSHVWQNQRVRQWLKQYSFMQQPPKTVDLMASLFLGCVLVSCSLLLPSAALPDIVRLVLTALILLIVLLAFLYSMCDLGQAVLHEQRRSINVRFATVGLLLATILYGIVRLQHADFEPGPNVALIQGNLGQEFREARGETMAQHYAKLAVEASTPKEGFRPDLVIWPETSYVDPWFDLKSGVELRQTSLQFQRAHNLFRDGASENVARWRVPQLLGLNSIEWESDEKQWKYNSAILMDARGNYKGRYDKIHLVPFGEYVPFRETFPFMKWFTPYEGDYSCKPGEMYTRFDVKGQERTYLFGVIICYEDSDPALGRAFVEPGTDKVDFLVNISNDGWFKGEAEHEQHLAIARFRAVESRRSLVRAVNMGVSAIIDPDGRVLALPGETWAKSKQVEGVVRGNVPIDQRASLYAQFGDWFPMLCWLVMLGVLIRARFTRPKQTV